MEIKTISMQEMMEMAAGRSRGGCEGCKAGPPKQPDSIVRVLEERIADLKARAARRMAQAAVLEKALAEARALGAERIDRVIFMANEAEDPDNPRPIVMGPHGPGCECAPEARQ